MKTEKKQILQSLVSGRRNLYDIMKEQDLCIKDYYKLVKSMEKDKIIKIKSGFCELTSKGKSIAEDYKIREFNKKSKWYDDLLSNYVEICKSRPSSTTEYDQGFMSAESAIAKLKEMHYHADIYGKIVLVGDDDLFSILLGITNLPKKVVALDIDERIIKYIREVSKRLKLNVEAYVYDVRKSLPSKFVRSFDVFICEPVETLRGFKLFVKRGAVAVKDKNSTGYIGLTTLEASYKKWYEIEKFLNDIGFVITDINRNFTVYPELIKKSTVKKFNYKILKKFGEPSVSDWYRASLIRVKAIKKLNVDNLNVKIGRDFYIDDETWATLG